MKTCILSVRPFFRTLLLLLLLSTSLLPAANAIDLQVKLTKGLNGTGLPNQYLMLYRRTPTGPELVATGSTDANGLKTFTFQNTILGDGYNRYYLNYFRVNSVFPTTDTLQIADTTTFLSRAFLVADEMADCQIPFTHELINGDLSTGQVLLQFDPYKAAQCYGYYTNPTYQYPLMRVRWFVNGVRLDSFTVGGAGIWNGYSSLAPFDNKIIRSLGFGYHQVCLQIFSETNGDTSTFCKTIQVATRFNYVTGAIKANNAFVFDSVDVELFRLDSAGYRTTKAYVKNDSLVYGFHQVLPGKYMVRATPYGPILSPLYGPTYGISSPTWESADTVRVFYSPTLWGRMDVNLLPYFIQTGIPRPGIVQGYISGIGTICQTVIPNQSGTRPVLFESQKVRLMVMDNQGRLIASAFVNPDGTFYIDNLPLGPFYLRIDHPLVNNQTIPVIFTETNPAMVVQATVTESGLQTITTTKKQIAQPVLAVFPNPTQESIQIPAWSSVQSAILVNSLGKKMPLEIAAQTEVKNLEPGIYFLQGTWLNGEPFTVKIQKQ